MANNFVRPRSDLPFFKETMPQNSSKKVERDGKQIQKQGNQMDIKKINESLKVQLDELKLQIEKEQKDRKQLDLELGALKLQYQNVQKINESFKIQLNELTVGIDNEQKDRKQLDLELEAIKLLYRNVQIENVSLKIEKQVQNEVLCTLRDQLHECEMERKKLETENDNFPNTAGCSITSVECTATGCAGTSSLECTASLSLTEQEGSSSNGLNHGSNPSTWRKVDAVEEYNNYEDNLKKFLIKQTELVNYIKESVFEDEIEPFIQKSIKIIFRKHFFLKSTSYYHEENKACFKDSKILKCLMESMETKLGEKVATIDLKETIKANIKKFKADVKRNPILWVEKEEN